MTRKIYISDKQMFYKLSFETGHHVYKASWTPMMNKKLFEKKRQEPRLQTAASLQLEYLNLWRITLCCWLDMFQLNYLPSFSTFLKKTRTRFCLHILLRRDEKLNWWCLAVTEPSQKIKE